MKGEIIDPRIVPGVLVTLNQRIKYVPVDIRTNPKFDIQRSNIPIWQPVSSGPARPYEGIRTGTVAAVIGRYVEREVVKLEIIVNGRLYRCYGIHADLLE